MNDRRHPRRHQRVGGADGRVQRLEQRIQSTVVLFVGLGRLRRDALDGGEHGDLLAVSVPIQDLVEEPIAIDDRG
jgi:hypothetical protein